MTDCPDGFTHSVSTALSCKLFVACIFDENEIEIGNGQKYRAIKYLFMLTDAIQKNFLERITMIWCISTDGQYGLTVSRRR